MFILDLIPWLPPQMCFYGGSSQAIWLQLISFSLTHELKIWNHVLDFLPQPPLLETLNKSLWQWFQVFTVFSVELTMFLRSG